MGGWNHRCFIQGMQSRRNHEHPEGSWLPYIKIIQPEELKNIFLNDMKTWISWQKES